jgi:hypothetical protein
VETTTCVRYLQRWGKFDAVRLACTCGPGSPHGLVTWPSPEEALESPTITESMVRSWSNNPYVSALSRAIAAA